jgi:Mg2+-importing ATPase
VSRTATSATASEHVLPTLFEVAASESERSLQLLGSAGTGLATTEAGRRLELHGPNAVRIRRTRGWLVLGRQLRSPLLLLLAVTATASYFVGEHTDAIIIGVILLLSVGLGFWNEFRAEQAAEALRSKISYSCLAWREGGRCGSTWPRSSPATWSSSRSARSFRPISGS